MGQARYIDSQDTFRLTLHGFCGMPIPIVEEGTMEECRSAAARHIRVLRTDGYPVVTLNEGIRWEVREPENCAMVPDDCGILSLCPVQIRVFECWDCGSDVPEGESCNCMEPCEEEEEEEEEEETPCYSGICHDCGEEWESAPAQNVCPKCESANCDIMEEDSEG